jgi:hypothetical protein
LTFLKKYGRLSLRLKENYTEERMRMPDNSTVSRAPTEEFKASFNWEEFTDYFPADEELSAYLTALLSEQRHGWATPAHLLIKLRDSSVYTQKLQDRLVEMIRARMTQPVRQTPVTISPRDGLRIYLLSLSNEALESYIKATEVSVSYDSFMRGSTADKAGLIESILDESGVE